MSIIDKQRIAAVETLRSLGYTYTDGKWHQIDSQSFEDQRLELIRVIVQYHSWHVNYGSDEEAYRNSVYYTDALKAVPDLDDIMVNI